MSPEHLTPESLEPRVRSLVSTDPAHDWHHVVRVFRLGVRIFEQLRAEAADVESICGGRPDGPILWGSWPQPTADDEAALRIALVCHDLGEKKGGGPNALVDEEELLAALDGIGLSEHALATALEAIGAVGVARCFALGGFRGRPIHDPDQPEGGSLGHFRQKLLLIHDRLNLAVSRQMAEERHQFLVEFEARFLAEFSGGC
jgi:uncharacterized protein